MKSEIGHTIKHREKPNDQFFTPEALSRELIRLVPFKAGETLLDNAVGKGAFYNNFPEYTINSAYDKEVDFLTETKKYDWLITNPPYSFLDEWLDKSCEVAEKGFAYLFTIHNLTPKRIEACEKKGFFITKIHLCKVFQWYGISAFIIFEKNKPSIFSYDRVVWR